MMNEANGFEVRVMPELEFDPELGGPVEVGRYWVDPPVLAIPGDQATVITFRYVGGDPPRNLQVDLGTISPRLGGSGTGTVYVPIPAVRARGMYVYSVRVEGLKGVWKCAMGGSDPRIIIYP